MTPTLEKQIMDRRSELMGYAMKWVRNKDDAEDAVQETFVRALANSDSFERGTNLGAWLITIMKNYLRGQYRRASRTVYTDDPRYADSLVASDNPHEVLAAKEELVALGKMRPARQRILLRRGVGCSYSQLAREFGVCENTAKTLIRRARNELCALTGRARVNLHTGAVLSPLSR